MKVMKPCMTIGCKELSTGSYCTVHANEMEAERTDRRRTYEPWRVIYPSKKWRIARDQAKARDGYQCRAIMLGKRCTETEKLQVHHIQSLRNGGEPYDLDNLVTLCPKHHKRAENQ